MGHITPYGNFGKHSMMTTDNMRVKLESVPDSEKDQEGVVLIEERPNGYIVHDAPGVDKFYHDRATAMQAAFRGQRRFYIQRWQG